MVLKKSIEEVSPYKGTVFRRVVQRRSLKESSVNVVYPDEKRLKKLKSSSLARKRGLRAFISLQVRISYD